MTALSFDRVVFESASVQIGAFRCPVDHPAFVDSGPIRNHCFVFPRTAVVIQHRDERPFAADPTIATLYNKGQLYRRQPISPEGDRCDWYSVSASIVREAVSEYDQRAADDEARPIHFSHAGVDADTYLLQRRLFTTAAHDSPDSLFVEETVCELLHRVIARAYADGDRPGVKRHRWMAADELAYAASELIGRRFDEALSLADIASALGASVYHLCRSFRQSTGTTLHEYRNQLRLRTALDRLDAGDSDLSQLALDLGYSSHSHFTAAFRRAFGVTPSAVRRHLRASS